MSRASASTTCGLDANSRPAAASPMTTTRLGATATASADRGPPSSSSRYPISIPVRPTSMSTASPSGEHSRVAIRPEATTNIASPGSPAR
jgi:hypothetical protein